ncbi:hypothetical protein GQ55_2G421600 [Panicum hallii var. hallii]|uniref:Uncharacterized protein n=1 Tax=Panicum hallii var. hallii TaxID=1504633 RepID=A0A2T7EY59_9POAL|nr:hypothetical protein GQ55_2G421600 [Panicum hallii var. hallii]
MDGKRLGWLALPAPPPPESPPVAAASAPASPYSVLHELLLPSPNPHLLLKQKTLTHSLSSSSLTSMASSSPPAPTADVWELVTPTAPQVAHVDGGLDDCAIFPPRLHEGLGLGLEGESEEAVPAAPKEVEVEEEEEEEEEEDGEWLWDAWGWRWERCRLAARRAWTAGVGAVQDRVLVHGACGCPAVKPAVLSAAAAAAVVVALLYARRRDRRERDLLMLLTKEKDKRIAQLMHQIALMSDIRSGSEAVKIIRNS